MTSHSRFQTNVLKKFVDTTCIFRDAGAAIGQGSNNGVKGNGNFSKTIKQRYKLCLFLLSTMLTSKIITNYRIILNFLSVQIAAINLFQVDLDKP